jgi:hypothetical protein
VTLISHAATLPSTGSDFSDPEAISAGGRYVAFSSLATDLIAGGSDANESSDAFLWDRDTGAVTLVSHAAVSPTAAAAGFSDLVSMSASGRYLTFRSDATDLIAGGSDANGTNDAFFWDRDTGTVALVSHAAASSTTTANDYSYPTAISADGRYVALASYATNLIAGGTDTEVARDVFLWDRDTGTVTLVSHTPSSTMTPGDGDSEPRAVSADGRYVVFSSSADDLIAGGTDSNSSGDAFFWDREANTVTLLSHSAASATTAGLGESSPIAMSADGRFVALTSSAPDLILGGADTNDLADAFSWDRDTGAVRLVSHTTGSGTTAGDDGSEPVALSSDGQFMAFYSHAGDLLPGNFNEYDQTFLGDHFWLFADGFESADTSAWSQTVP